MSTTYYRIHDTRRCAPEALLTAEHQRSIVWIGHVERRCVECSGTGCGIGGDEDGPDECSACGGSGWLAIAEQAGVSVCRSLDALTRYLRERDAYTESCVVVELEGEECDDDDVDAASGAVLIRPTRIMRTLDIRVLGLGEDA